MADKTPNKRHKRQFKNYLLDRGFQLKYAGLLFAVAGVLSVVLGFLLWRTSQALVVQSREAVAKGQQVVLLGQQVAKESRKVSSVVEMNIVKDPFYADNPELLAAFKEDAANKDAVVIEQQRLLQEQARALGQQSAELEERQRTMLVSLFGMLTLLVFAVGLVGIVVTHKVAGPIFKMTRQINQLGEGSWRLPAPLRQGDELVHFFGAFAKMVHNLRAQRERELDMLDQAQAALAGDGELSALRGELAKVLED